MQERLIDSIVSLRRLERGVSDPALELEARETRAVLEELAGPTVKPAAAARSLGISQPALGRWIEQGHIATVLTPAARYEIPLAELVELLETVDEARERGGVRVLSRIFREQEAAADEIDLEDLFPEEHAGGPHSRPEIISLLYHRLLARRLTRSLLDDARRRLARWRNTGVIDKRWVTEWEHVLSRPAQEIARTISADAPHLAQLRQSSPFAGLLPAPERRRILEAVEERVGG